MRGFFCRFLAILQFIPLISSAKIALLIIDVQNCFLSGGSLAVQDGDDIIPVINEIRSKYDAFFSLVVLSQDWHCSDHVSFASQHEGRRPLEGITLQYTADKQLCNNSSPCDAAYNVSQTLWPDHCVINTTSAEFGRNLTRKASDRVVRKGYNCQVDSYSAFFDNGKFENTELHSLLRNAGIDTVFVVGLATDYCVYFTSLDARQLGYKTYLIEDATRGVEGSTTASALADMMTKGVALIESKEIGPILENISSKASIREISPITSLLATLVFLAFFDKYS